jgi:hypothetical protein
MPVSPAATISESAQEVLAKFITVKLEADTASLTRNERRMLPLLVDARGDARRVLGAGRRPRDSVLSSITDPATRRLADVMVGPWNRL